MMRVNAHHQIRAYDYTMPESVEKSKEAPDLLPPLYIENTMGEIMTHIPKGAFKKSSHNPNARVAHNYFVIATSLVWRSSRVSPHRERRYYSL
jgi:hypothetical protein